MSLRGRGVPGSRAPKAGTRCTRPASPVWILASTFLFGPGCGALDSGRLAARRELRIVGLEAAAHGAFGALDVGAELLHVGGAGLTHLFARFRGYRLRGRTLRKRG